MYNFITNSWENVEHQITFDVRQPKTQRHVIEKLKQWLKDNPDTDVVRFTTFSTSLHWCLTSLRGRSLWTGLATARA